MGAFAHLPDPLSWPGIWRRPADHLKDIGIPCRNDLPVGEGLQDHVLARTAYHSRNVVTLNGVMNSPLRQAAAGMEYLLARRGPLSIAATEACLFAYVEPKTREQTRSGRSDPVRQLLH